MSDILSQLLQRTTRTRNRFNRERFKALVNYICWICDNPRALGQSLLGRVLWYSERNAFLETGRWISGATFVRQQAGPHPRPLEPTLQELEREGIIARRLSNDSSEFDLLFALKRPDLSQLQPAEISVVDAVVGVLCFESRGKIAHQAAHDRVWQAAQIGEPLPHFTVFAGRPGELLPVDINWATRVARASSGSESQSAAAELLAHENVGAGDIRKVEAVEAALWHLNHDPSIGTSLPTADASWFVYKQSRHQTLAVPEIAIVYRFDVNELLPEAMRFGDPGDDDSF